MITVLIIFAISYACVIIFCAVVLAVRMFRNREFADRLNGNLYVKEVHDFLSSARRSDSPLLHMRPTARQKLIMCRLIASLKENFADYGQSRTGQLSDAWGLEDFMVGTVLRSSKAARLGHLKTLAALPVSGANVDRLESAAKHFSPQEAFQLMLLKLSARPREAESILKAHPFRLDGLQTYQTVHHICNCRIGADWQRCLASESVNMRLVGLQLVGSIGITEAEEAVYRSLGHSDREVQATAFKVLAGLKSPLGRPQVAAALRSASTIRRKRIYRHFVREGYSERALRPLIEIESIYGSELGGVIKAAIDCRRKTLQTTS